MLVLVAAGVGTALYSGAYNIAADEPHWAITERVMALLRVRSIEARARCVAAAVPAAARELRSTESQLVLKAAAPAFGFRTRRSPADLHPWRALGREA